MTKNSKLTGKITKILGIDPGTARLGFGVVDASSDGGLEFVAAGCLETTLETPMPQRLLYLFDEIDKLIASHKPDVLAIESLFFGINAKTAIAVGQARGVVLAAAAKNQVAEIKEYQGLSVKFAVTGFGRAKKKEIQEGVRKILKMREIVKPDDAADGLAIAITHHIKTNQTAKVNKKPISKSKKPNKI